MSTFLVTGGTGRIGTECIAQLASQGHRVKFATRNPGGATAQFREKFGPGTVRAVGMDVNDAASIDKALEDCTGALFISPIDESWHEQIAAQMKQSSLAFCVKVSVTGARGPDSDPPPGRLPSIHWRGEEHFRNSGVPTTCIRPTIFFNTFWDSIKSSSKQEMRRFICPPEILRSLFWIAGTLHTRQPLC